MTSHQNHWYQRYNLLIFDEIDSTNEEAKRLIKAGAGGEFVIWAKSQTKGKGRHERHWFSPEGNLYLSLLLKPKVEAIKASQISFVTAVALGEALNSLVMGQTESKVQYKWPNDIFLNGKKIGGILLESSNSSFKNASEWLVVGLGVNINYSPELATRYQATDLIKESVTSCTVDRLVDLFMKSFQDWRNKWQEQGFKAIRDAWLQNSFEQGSVITAIVGKERMSGVFEDLTNDGYIKLALAGGQVCYVSAGEIFYDVNEYKRYIDNTVIKL